MKKLFILIVAILGAGYLWYALALRPVDAEGSKRIKFTVEPGSTSAAIAEHLAEANLIRSPLAFKIRLKLHGLDGSLQAGVFLLDQSQSVDELVHMLQTGKAEEMIVTIPEGFTVKDIDALLAEEKLSQPDDILDCARVCDFSSFDFLPFEKREELAERGGLLEGYLFADTYYVEPDNVVPKFFLERMLGEFRTQVVHSFHRDIEASNRSLHEIITMAALIEKETRTNDERAMVSGILWKRFDEGMGLGVDATVRYIQDKKTGVLTTMDLNTNSPYNLRKFAGLTPGPIASAGLQSIKAALFPKASQYWYYMHGWDGVIHYAKTNEEHNINKYKYLR